MCCVFSSLVLFGPRLAILVWWLFNPLRFSLAFGSWITPLVLALFAPFTMLMYLTVWSPITGIHGFDWVWLGIAIALDVFSYVGEGYSNRHRLSGKKV
jgi:hypothetical protein